MSGAGRTHSPSPKAGHKTLMGGVSSLFPEERSIFIPTMGCVPLKCMLKPDPHNVMV